MKLYTNGTSRASIAKQHGAHEEVRSFNSGPVAPSHRRVAPPRKRRRVVVVLLLVAVVALLFYATSPVVPESATSIFSTSRCRISSESLFGLPIEQLAANIRRSYERFNSVEVDQALRRERGPPSYVYGGPLVEQHPEDNIRTVKAKFFAWCSEINDYTRLSALTAALSGFRVECIGTGWKHFSFVTYFGPTMGYLLANKNRSYFVSALDHLNDEDVVIFADTDLLYSGDADVYNVVRTFASVTAHSAAEQQRMTTRDPRESAGSVRWTRYARDVRTGSALAPFIVNGENNCYLFGLNYYCDDYFAEIFALQSAFLKQQEYYRERRRNGDVDNGQERGAHATTSDDLSPMFRINSGFFLARVWALRRVLLAAQNLVLTLPNCLEGECAYPIPGSPKHKAGAHRKDTNDQALIGLLYLRSRLQEYKPGGPLAVEYGSKDGRTAGTAAEVLTEAQHELLQKVAAGYDPLFDSSFIPSGASDSDGASLRLPDGMMMVDSHNIFSQIIIQPTTWHRSSDMYLSNATYPEEAHHLPAYYRSLRPYDDAMARHFEQRRQYTEQHGKAADGITNGQQSLRLTRSPLGNLLNEHVWILNPKKHTFACRADEVEANGTCSSLSFLRAASLITSDSPITFPPRNDLIATRPLSLHFPGGAKMHLLPHYLYLLPQLYPLLHPLVNHTRAACELARLTELLPPVRVWRLVGECGDVDAYRGGEGTGRAVTEELIWRSTRELGCLPAAAPDLVPLGDSGKDAELRWAAHGRR